MNLIFDTICFIIAMGMLGGAALLAMRSFKFFLREWGMICDLWEAFKTRKVRDQVSVRRGPSNPTNYTP